MALLSVLLAQAEEPSLGWEATAIILTVLAAVVGYFYSRAIKD